MKGISFITKRKCLWIFHGYLVFLHFFPLEVCMWCHVCRHTIAKQEYCFNQRKEYSAAHCFDSIILGFRHHSCQIDQPGYIQEEITQPADRVCGICILWWKCKKMLCILSHHSPRDMFYLSPLFSAGIWQAEESAQLSEEMRGAEEFRTWYLEGKKMTHLEKVKRT